MAGGDLFKFLARNWRLFAMFLSPFVLMPVALVSGI